jgi:hypothetical protein
MPLRTQEHELVDGKWWRLAEGVPFTATLQDAEVRTHFSERAGCDVEVKVLKLRTADGREGSLWAWHRVLDSKLSKLKPKRGETLEITLLGKPADRDYLDYAVRAPQRPRDDGFGDVWGTPPTPLPTPSPEPDVPGDQFGDEPPFHHEEVTWDARHDSNR